MSMPTTLACDDEYHIKQNERQLINVRNDVYKANIVPLKHTFTVKI